MMDAMIVWLNNNPNVVIGVLTIVAILISPITALWLQKKAENYNEEKQRKLGIFKTLLATRANTVIPEHVQALNMIDIEFYKQKEITDCWNIYRDHLNSYPHNADKSAGEHWEEKRVDFLTDILYSMSKFFGYNFDKVILKKGAYSPMAHGLFNLEQNLIRQEFVEIATGKKAIKVQVINQEEKEADIPTI
jgi:hypothetical protein